MKKIIYTLFCLGMISMTGATYATDFFYTEPGNTTPIQHTATTPDVNL